MCFCKGDLCNRGGRGPQVPGLLLGLGLASWLLVRWGKVSQGPGIVWGSSNREKPGKTRSCPELTRTHETQNNWLSESWDPRELCMRDGALWEGLDKYHIWHMRTNRFGLSLVNRLKDRQSLLKLRIFTIYIRPKTNKNLSFCAVYLNKILQFKKYNNWESNLLPLVHMFLVL